MKISKHAEARKKQRGFKSGDYDIIVEFGSWERKPSGAFECLLRKKDKDKAIAYYKQAIKDIERIAGKKAVLISSDAETVITAYNKK